MDSSSKSAVTLAEERHWPSMSTRKRLPVGAAMSSDEATSARHVGHEPPLGRAPPVPRCDAQYCSRHSRQVTCAHGVITGSSAVSMQIGQSYGLPSASAAWISFTTSTA